MGLYKHSNLNKQTKISKHLKLWFWRRNSVFGIVNLGELIQYISSTLKFSCGFHNFPLWLSKISLCACSTFSFFDSEVDWNLHEFHLFAILKKKCCIEGEWVCKCLCSGLLNSLCICLGVTYVSGFIGVFWKTAKLFSRVAWVICTATNNVQWFSSPSHIPASVAFYTPDGGHFEWNEEQYQK